MAFCSNCGNALGDGQQFCANCGQPAAQAPAAAAAAPQSAQQPTATPQPAAYAPPPAYSAPPATGPGYPPPPPPPGPGYATPPGYPPGAPQASGQYGQSAYGAQPKGSHKGLWIGLSSALLVVVIACVLVFVVFRGDIFGGEGSASSANFTGQEFDLSEKSTPSAIMTALMTNAGSPETVTGTFDVKINMEGDTSGMSSEEAAMMSEPWTLSGTMAANQGQQAGDFTVSIGMMGSTMDVALRAIGENIWVGLKDQWYMAPADTTMQLGGGGVQDSLTQLQSALAGMSIDPTRWLKNQAPVVEEKLDGDKVLHISGSDPDWAAMVGDLAQIMLNPEVQGLMDSTGEAGSSIQDQLPSADELLSLGSQLDTIFQNVQIDIWVDKTTATLRKATIVCDIVPPADTSSLDDSGLGGMMSGSGLTKISLDATITVNPFEDVTVEAPENAKTSDELQSDIEADPSLLGPLGELLMGMGGGMTGQ